MVDFISISSYFELSRDDAEAPQALLAKAWSAQRSRMLRFARGEERPLLVMELGYPSLPWAAAHPWDYVPREGGEADAEPQARC